MHHIPHHFDEKHALKELQHYLPTQTPLKDFIHHNTLHAFQELPFYNAIFTASDIFGYQVTFNLLEYRHLLQIGRIRGEILERVIRERHGELEAEAWKNRALNQPYEHNYAPRVGRLRATWKNQYHIDLDNLVQPLLFRILGSYLDQGIALWHFPFVDQGLLAAVRALEKGSLGAGFLRSRRARTLLLDEANCTITGLLRVLVADESLYERYLFDQQFAHRGWSGMVATVEVRPDSVLYPKKISLEDAVILELLLEIDALDQELGASKWRPLGEGADIEPLDLFAPKELTELEHVLMIWQDAFEWSYYDEVFAGLQHLRSLQQEPEQEDIPDKSMQAIFCIDEREDSLRRHLERVDPHCETLGCPGFFGVEFFFHPAGGKFYEKLCPAPVTPKYLVKETETGHKREHEIFHSKKSHHFFAGFFIALSLGLWAAVKLALNLFRPKMSPAISNAFSHMQLDADLIIENTDPGHRENDLQVGFSLTEMTDRVENLLRGIGMIHDFASIVYVMGHGSSSANNPHHGAHDCGACSGRPGSVNARVFAFMANHPKVRLALDERGLHLPTTTQFLGGLHDTAADEIAFFDEKNLSPENALAHTRNRVTFENALNLNAKERSRRFASINTKQDILKIREAIRQRSVSYFEPRPELGHGTNALCFVGHRSLTKGLFLDRRAFLNSYDYRTDPTGKRLLGVMRPLPPVCGGINLEYYFSRMDNVKLGAGTKLPHHVMGLIGVANSSDGDLRPGLPLQMIEVHDPVRLLILVEHDPEVVLRTIQTEPDLYQWFEQNWVHLAAIHPATNEYYIFKSGKFHVYKPAKDRVGVARDIHALIESIDGMETNHITHATKENLPIHVLAER
ncbi:MAG: YbcC family protein [Saprospiraceae bacterium]